jgi:hypothetical protein
MNLEVLGSGGLFGGAAVQSSVDECPWFIAATGPGDSVVLLACRRQVLPTSSIMTLLITG